MENKITEGLKDFFFRYKPKEYQKGDILIQAFEEPKGIFFLEEGTVKMFIVSKSGEEIALNVFKKNSFFPMSWAINNTQNTYYYEATSNTKARIAEKKEVIKFLENNPQILFDLLSRVYSGTDGLLKKISKLMSGNAYERLITELVIESKRFGVRNNKEIKLEVSERELAASTGMTRETVSREIKKLKNNNLIIKNKKVLTIINIEKLEEEIA